MGWKKKIQNARERHRPDLKDWECDEIYKHFPLYVDSLSERTNESWMNHLSNIKNYRYNTNSNNNKNNHNNHNGIFGIRKNKKYDNNKKTPYDNNNDHEEYSLFFDHPYQMTHPQNQFRCFRVPSSLATIQSSSSSNKFHHSSTQSSTQHPSKVQHHHHNHYRRNLTNNQLSERRVIEEEDIQEEKKENDYHQKNNKIRQSNNNNGFNSNLDERCERDNDNINLVDYSDDVNFDVMDYVPAVLDAKTLTKEEFWYRFEGPCIPCIIKNIPYGYDDGKETNGQWPALKKWNLQTLIQYNNQNIVNDNNNNNPNVVHKSSSNSNANGQCCKEKYGSIANHNKKDGNKDNTAEEIAYFKKLRNRRFKCGEDDDGDSIKIRLKYFLHYMMKNYDDSPLYIFDSSFERDKYSKSLLDDYKVPSYFANDLFTGLISEQRRPPYRWVLFGPQRSGSTVHIDPLATNAWNTLLEGRKRWVLFPPYIPKHIVKGKGLVREKEDDEAVHYFMYILPRIRQNAIKQYYSDRKHQDNATSANYDMSKPFVCYEFTQNPGETVFIPNGWWHAVLNLDHTVGVTQNYVSERNFINVWIETRSGRKRMAWKWLQNLKIKYPHLYKQAIDINTKDKYIMKYNPIHYEQIQNAKKLRKMKHKEKQKEKQKQQQSKSDHSKEDDDDEERDKEEVKKQKKDGNRNNNNEKEKQLSNSYHDSQEHRKKMRLVV